MNMELLQNKDVLIKVLLLLVPTVAAFSVSVVYLFRSKKNNERGGADSGELTGAAMLFIPVCMTNLMYSVMSVLLLFVNGKITVDKITGVSIAFFLMVSVLSVVSCIMKGIIGGLRLSDCTGAEKQKGISKAMLYMAAAEFPGLIAFALFMIKFIM
jgi:hypothetical protein